MGLSDLLKGVSLPKKIALVVGSSVVLCGTAYGIYKFYCSKKIEQENEEETTNERKILVLGLDGSGKTTFLSALSQQGHKASTRQDVKPTEGFNVMCVSTNGFDLNFWEIGGRETLRSYWPNFTFDTDVLIYAVDSCDKNRFEESKNALKEIRTDKNLKDVPVIVLKTKMDLPDHSEFEKIAHEFDMIITAARQGSAAVGIQVPPGAPGQGIGRVQDVLLQMCDSYKIH